MGKYLDKIRQHENPQPIETVKAEEALKQQKALDPIPTLHPGDLIEWERADLTVQHGVVDVLHIDDAGTHWAFVTLGKRWAVVNMKFAKGSSA